MTIEELIRHIVSRRSGDWPYLYHATDEANWESISTYGLLSKKEKERQNIVPQVSTSDPNSSRIDMRTMVTEEKSLAEFVSLAFRPDNKVIRYAYFNRLENPILVRIHPGVMRFESTYYANDVANKSGVNLELLETAIVDDSDIGPHYFPANSRAEVLIHQKVPADMIAGKEKIEG